MQKKADKNEDWMQYMRNPQAFTIKKYMFDILQERFSNNELILDRIVYALQTKEDMENWGRLIADIYELGFQRAVDQYKGTLQKLGYNVNVIPAKADEPTSIIFQSEKSG